MEQLGKSLRSLRWKLTLSFTAVTVSSLLVVGLVVGGALFSRILIPDLWITPETWMEAANRSAVPILSNLLSQEPVDRELVSIWLDEIDMMLSSDELLQVGEAQFFISTAVRMDVLVISADGTLLGIYNPGFLPEAKVGAPFDVSTIPGLNQPFRAAMSGETDPQKLFAITEPDEKYVGAIPIMSEAGNGEVLGVIVADVQSMPTRRDTSKLTLQLVGRISLFFLLGAAIVGAIFGSITARSMSNRFQRLAHTADAWSEGNFTEFIDDHAGDEISLLSSRLNRMAAQLKDLLRRRQEMAVSEERNRLARDLHDSAKQQALAASFQIGTALTLFDREPKTAKGHLEEAECLVDSVREELTDLILELRPQSLEDKPIDEILGEYAIDWSHQHDIELDPDMLLDLELNLEQKQTLFRILQEALANVARHSDGTCVSLALGSDGEKVNLVVKDDGKGFSPEEVTGGMGLHSMRERAESLGGSLEVTSAPGEGTSLSVVIPK
jgi:signal transduction histidine kinase